MAKETLTQRRAALTEKVNEARQNYFKIFNLVKYEVRKANPGLQKSDWAKFYNYVECDIRVQLANARLKALCDAANIMGAEIF